MITKAIKNKDQITKTFDKFLLSEAILSTK